MSINEEAVRAEVERVQSKEEAARRMTHGLATAIKITLPIAWLLPIIPIIGFVGLVLGAATCAVMSMLMIAKGATSRGIKYLLISGPGSGLVIILWIAMYGTLVAVMG